MAVAARCCCRRSEQVDDGKGDAMRRGNNLDSHKQTAGGHTNTYINSDTSCVKPETKQAKQNRSKAKNRASEAVSKLEQRASK